VNRPAQFPLPEHGLPALPLLLDGPLWSEWAAAGRVFEVTDFRASVGYLRWKPDTSCRLTVVGTSGGKGERPPLGFLLHLYPDRERARTAYEKLIRREPVIGEEGFEPFLSEDPPLVAAPFPNDPELPSLRYVYDPTRFRRALSKTRPNAYPAGEWRLQKRHIRTELLAYKPGRRAVFRVRVGVRHESRDEKVRLYWHVKVATPETAGPSVATARAIEAAVGTDRHWRVPETWGFIESRSWSSTEWVVGDSLESDLESAQRVGAALAEFHSLQVELPQLPTPTEESRDLQRLTEDLVLLIPTEETRIRALSKKLQIEMSTLAIDRVAPLHGDLHLDQIVLVGDQVVFVDLDRSGIGIPVTDLGSFAASSWSEGRSTEFVDAFLEGYRSGGTLPDRRDLEIATAHQLFRRAVFPFRNLDPKWPERTIEFFNQIAKLIGD